VAGVEVASAVLQILGREEDLGRVQAVGGEGLVVRLDESALTDGGGGLEFGQVGGASFPAKTTDAGGDGPAAHQDDLPPVEPEAGQLVGDGGDAGVVEGAVLAGEDAAADLHHDGVGGGHDFLANE